MRDRQEPGQRAHERRLAGGVGSYQRQSLTGLQREADVRQDAGPAAIDAKLVGLE